MKNEKKKISIFPFSFAYKTATTILIRPISYVITIQILYRQIKLMDFYLS